MKRAALAILISGLVVSVGAVSAQQTPPQSKTTKSMDISVTGCLIQGSGPTVFLLDNARVNPNDTVEKTQKYLVLNHIEDVNLATHLNHEVTFTGTADYKNAVVPMTTTPIVEKNLPTLTAKSMVMVADRCTAAR